MEEMIEYGDIAEDDDGEYIVLDIPVPLTVKEYCEQYGLNEKTVYKRIEYNKDKALAGHIIKEKGKPMLLDEWAQEFLKPISARIKEVTEYCEETIKKNDRFENKAKNLSQDKENLQSECDRLNGELTVTKAELEHTKACLESCKSSLSECQFALSECKSQLENSRADVAERDGIISDLRAELDSEREIFNTVLNDKSNIISDRDSTIKALEEAQEAAAKKGKGFLGLRS